ncbi:DUF4367 domain-containing protein [Paenibacillus sp. LMG 31456]|uniref:DUF4367 domain-containing protein n=1 Tax=Paenibacillus foliorum TaxID=2654974 RepID=A0A972GUX0_9BACL|nr:DUF4367 domain-containing protein [Paenibacillus foliorum]NOU97107.1 DUF4367 domain-containing protein [Paenibacillus foliorum]
MDRKWLLLFKGNVFSLTVIVQRSLFEQYITVLSEQVELCFLDRIVVQQVAADVFLWAAKHRRYFGGLDEEQIVGKLRELTRLRICKLKLVSTTLPSEQQCSSTELMMMLAGAWKQVSKRIQKQRRQRLISTRLGSVGFMVTALVLGGLIFGMVVTTASVTGTLVSASTGISSSNGSADANPVVEGPVTLTELNLREQEVKKYADFKMFVPAYLPQGYTFDNGLAWLRQGQRKSDHTMLVYTNDKKHLLRVSYYKLHKNGVLTTGSFGPESSKEVFIRGTKALLITSLGENNFVKLNWTENDTYISISGRELEEAELVKIAKSLK